MKVLTREQWKAKPDGLFRTETHLYMDLIIGDKLCFWHERSVLRFDLDVRGRGAFQRIADRKKIDPRLVFSYVLSRP